MSHSDPLPASSEPADKPSSTHSSSGRLRRNVLFGLLLLMLGALWYDRQVAQPGVESAFDRVEQLNQQTNAQKNRKLMTNKDVQDVLTTAPARVFSVGGYQVEVYSWRAGLPIKTRDYYAVFSSAPPNRFLKHYKFELPLDELTGEAAFVEPSNPSPTDPSTTVNHSFGAPHAERPKDRQKDRPAKEDGATSDSSQPTEGQKGAATPNESGKSIPGAERPPK